MKASFWLFVLAVALLTVSFLPTNRLLPEWAHSSGFYDLKANEINGPTLYLVYGSVVEIDVTISGGNDDLYFYIKNADGERVFDAGTISGTYHLERTETALGSLKLNFDNSMSWFTHKQVTWSLKESHYNTLFLFLGISMLIFGASMIGREKEEEIFIRKARLETWRATALIGSVIFLFSAFLPFLSVFIVSVSLGDYYYQLFTMQNLPTVYGVLHTMILYPLTLVLAFVGILKRRFTLVAGIVGVLCWIFALFSVSIYKLNFNPSTWSGMIQYGTGIFIGLIGAFILLVSFFLKPHARPPPSTFSSKS